MTQLQATVSKIHVPKLAQLEVGDMDFCNHCDSNCGKSACPLGKGQGQKSEDAKYKLIYFKNLIAKILNGDE